MIDFLGISWANINAFFYAPFFIVLIVLIFWRVARIKKATALLAFPSMVSRFFNNYSTTRLYTKAGLLVVGFLFLFLTLLRPQWGKSEQRISQQGRDLFIALDISRSMLAQDVKPNRLAFAKAKIKKLLSCLASERVGLLLFSGSTFVQCPLTSDYAAFELFLDAVDVETVSSGTTALDQAIYKVVQLFAAMGVKKNKLLVIFTDGEDFSSNLSGIKQKAQAMGLHIFTCGVGTQQGAPVPIVDDFGNARGVERDDKGNVVISALNEGILHALATDTGGAYIRTTVNDDDLKRLVHKVHSYEKEQFEDKKISSMPEQYPYFLAVSFFCFMLEWLL